MSTPPSPRYHRLGAPGGPACRVVTLPVQGRGSDGTFMDAALLDAGTEASEVELLRAVAHGLGVQWGHDEFGWWAAVPATPASHFSSAGTGTTDAEETPPPSDSASAPHALFREDDNGARFLIAHFPTRALAEQRAQDLAHGGHKQHYFVEPVAQ